MNNENIYEESVETKVSFSKKEQQIKLYILDRLNATGGGQGAYNTPSKIVNEMKESGIIEVIDLSIVDGNGNPMNTYTLIKEYRFILSKNIRKLIDYNNENVGVLFIEGIGTKFHIRKTTCNKFKKIPGSELDLEWFVKLYDENPRPSEIIYILDKNLKTLEMDIKITYNLEEPDSILELDEDEVYDNKSYESGDIYRSKRIVLKPLEKWTQKIYFGPPGTGKSYNISKEILEEQIKIGLIPEKSEEYDSGYVYRTTIYPEYSYYDFIGNIMPIVDDDGKITYDFNPGIFTLSLAKALELRDNNIPIYLVIEEISRGNIASIFGDIFQLLDRDKDGMSEYKIDNDIISNYFIEEQIAEYKTESVDNKNEIYLPSNFNILGTMNTSDQNVFVMDTAFKRRFEFEYVDTDPVKDGTSDNYLNQFEFKLDQLKYNWINFYQQLNRYIIEELELPEDKQIGQFFIKFDNNHDEENYKQLQNKLLQYLWEDVHLIKIVDNNLFKEEYKSFSEIYKDFGKQNNIFSDNFMRKLDKEYTSEDKSEIDLTKHSIIDEEVNYEK